MSIFYGFLKLINFSPFVRNSWHRHKPWRRETLPTAVCPNCQVFNPKSLGAKPDFTCFPRSGESLSVFERRRVLLVVSLHSLCATGERHGVPDSLFPELSPHPEPCLGYRGTEAVAVPHQAAHPQCPCQTREHRLGVWFFSASQVPVLARGVCSQRQ